MIFLQQSTMSTRDRCKLTTRARMTPIALQRDEVNPDAVFQERTFKLREILTQADSDTYKFTMKPNECWPYDHFLMWRKNWQMVDTHKNITNYVTLCNLCLFTLEGEPKNRFTRLLDAEAGQNVATFDAVMETFMTEMTAVRGARNLKKYMQSAPKPYHMNIKLWIGHMRQLNAYLEMMPEGDEYEEDELARLIFDNAPLFMRTSAERAHIVDPTIPEMEEYFTLLEAGEQAEKEMSGRVTQTRRTREN